MSEFRIHHDVNELLSLLRVHGGDGAEVYIDLLQRNRTPYVTTTVSAHSAKVSACPRCCAGHKAHLPAERPQRCQYAGRQHLSDAFHGPCFLLKSASVGSSPSPIAQMSK